MGKKTRRVRIRVGEVGEERGWTVWALHLESRVAYPTVKQYWRGDIKYIDTATLQALADALNVDASALVTSGADEGDPTERRGRLVGESGEAVS